MTTVDPTELLTAAEIAWLLKCSRSQVYKMLHDGELRTCAVKLFGSSRGWRWRRHEVEAMIERHTIGKQIPRGGVKKLRQSGAYIFKPEMLDT